MTTFIIVCIYPYESILLFIDSKVSSVQVSSVPAAQVPYTLSLCVRVSSTHPVSKVESNCSLDPIEYLNPEKTQTTVGILLAHRLCVGLIYTSLIMCMCKYPQVKLAAGHKFDRDVELLIYYVNAHQPAALVEAGQTSAKTCESFN